MNSLFLLLAGVKFAGPFKILLSAGSIFLSIFTYAMLYGWSFAAGFVGLIFCHEMGHYIAARHKNVHVGLPMFIPFIGAWIALKEQPVDAETEAYIAYAGPLVGTLACFATYYWARENDSALAMTLAQSGFLLNLFNLIPLHPLDGGRITSVISPKLWFFGVPILIAVWIRYPSPIFILVAILAFPQLISAWRYDPKAPENKAYYAVKDGVKFEYGLLYIGLVVTLALMIQSLDK